jgi:galactoside O-acetyltransferase
MTIREKMKAGHLYTDLGEGLDDERERCKELTYDYNLTRPSEGERRRDLLEQLLGSCGNSIWIEPLVHMAYGKHVHIGDGFYANFNLVLVDDGDIYIGDNVSQRHNFAYRTSGASRSSPRRNAVFFSHQNRR